MCRSGLNQAGGNHGKGIKEDRTLTRLYDRNQFFEKARPMISEHEPSYCVLSCVIIDNFKVINAKHGNAVGDKVIHHVAESNENSMEQIGGICAHIASDEFAALYPSECVRSEALTEGYAAASAPDCIFQRIRLRVGRFIIDELTHHGFSKHNSSSERFRAAGIIYLQRPQSN